MVNNNGIPIEVNKKPFETVYELKNEIPSFEEFMKDYKVDENLNYDDLKNGDISKTKGYGPCESCHPSSASHDKSFRLHIILKNSIASKTKRVYNTYDASIASRDIESSSGYWKGGIMSGIFSEENRNCLAENIREAINRHNSGQEIDEECISASRVLGVFDDLNLERAKSAFNFAGDMLGNNKK